MPAHLIASAGTLVAGKGSGALRDAHGRADEQDGTGVASHVVAAKVRMPVLAALHRQRLESRLDEAWRRRLTLVVAPAGSGKTTLLVQFAAASGAPVAWYRAESLDGDEATFTRHLEAALAPVVPGLRRGWHSVDSALRALNDVATDSAPAMGSPVLLVVDDFHALEGTAAETAFGRLVEQAPGWLTLVLGTRVAPRLHLSRLRVAGELLEIESDDLRFRSWEVEQLFRDVYRDPVPPADLAVLARRVEGWAAGLQLFHLATRGRPAEERRRLLGGPGGGGRMLREYLAQNVMVGLPAELQDFLLDTYVLGRLTGRLCDRMRGVPGSAALLEELVRRGVFTVPAEDGEDAYRYHEVMRSYLDRVAVMELGEVAVRERHAAAGHLLEDAGFLAEALRAYSRAEDLDAVRRLLGGQGERLAAIGAQHWTEGLPPAIERHDPWVALAAARRARNDGRFGAAIAAYAHAEAGLGMSRAAEAPRRERLALAAWLDPDALPTPDAAGLLRAGLVRDPAGAAREALRLDDPAAPVTAALLSLAAGDVAGARRGLDRAIEDGVQGATAHVAAHLGVAVAAVMAGEPWDGRRFDAAVEDAERMGVAWLARLGRSLARTLGPVAAVGSSTVPEHPAVEARGDERWPAALLALARAWAAPTDPATAEVVSADAAEAFHGLGSGVLEAWATALRALAAAAGPKAPAGPDLALAAGRTGRIAGVPGAQAIAEVARLAVAAPGLEAPVANGTAEVATHARGVGLAVPAWAKRLTATMVKDGEDAPAEAAEGTAGRRIGIRLLGGCRLEVDGRRILLEGAKPRVRSLFRLLAVHAGAPVHREVIQDALWPDADAAAGARNLHVALSSLRHELDQAAQPFGSGLLVREGDAYRLDVTPQDVDLGRFDQAIAAGRAARAGGAGAVAASWFSKALDAYAGELLPEEGPAEWAAARREQARARVLEAAEGLASEALLVEDHATVIRACRLGLELDRCQDALWRMLITARERAGDAGAASRDRREYALVLESLGIPGGTTLAAALR